MHRRIRPASAMRSGACPRPALIERMPRASLQWLPEAPHDPDAPREGRVDLEIGQARVADASAQALLQERQPLVGVARPDHPLLQGRSAARSPSSKRSAQEGEAPVSLADYAAARHVDVSPRLERRRRWTAPWPSTA